MRHRPRGRRWLPPPAASRNSCSPTTSAPRARPGSRTRLAPWAAGALIDRPVIHDFHEEVFIVEGELVVGCDAEGQGGEAFGPYTFACRPPGVWHGPFVSPAGCVMLEFQYYG